MTVSTKIAVGGILLGLAIYGYALFIAGRHQRELDTKVAECALVAPSQISQFGGEPVTKLECDPAALYFALVSVHHPVQADIIALRAKIRDTQRAGLFGGLILMAIAIIPALWYFLLRRLAEIGSALRGNA